MEPTSPFIQMRGLRPRVGELYRLTQLEREPDWVVSDREPVY